MKRLISLFMALALVLTLTFVTFAAPSTTYGLRIDPTGYQLIEGVIDPSDKIIREGGLINPGATVCHLLYYETFLDGERVSSKSMSKPEEVEKFTTNQTWQHFSHNDATDKHVESVEIAKEKYGMDEYYFLVVKIKDFEPTYGGGVSGRISVTMPAAVNENGEEIDRFKATLEVHNSIGYERAQSIDSIVPEIATFYKMGNIGYNALNLTGEQTLIFESGQYFDVDLTAEHDLHSDLLIYYDEKDRASLSAVYPNANLKFLNFNGVTFFKKGVLTIPAEQGSYLYIRNADGSLTAADAVYDEYEEALKLTTKTLGKYVISDTKLKPVAAPSAAAPSAAVSSVAAPSSASSSVPQYSPASQAQPLRTQTQCNTGR